MQYSQKFIVKPPGKECYGCPHQIITGNAAFCCGRCIPDVPVQDNNNNVIELPQKSNGGAHKTRPLASSE